MALPGRSYLQGRTRWRVPDDTFLKPYRRPGFNRLRAGTPLALFHWDMIGVFGSDAECFRELNYQ